MGPLLKSWPSFRFTVWSVTFVSPISPPAGAGGACATPRSPGGSWLLSGGRRALGLVLRSRHLRQPRRHRHGDGNKEWNVRWPCLLRSPSCMPRGAQRIHWSGAGSSYLSARLLLVLARGSLRRVSACHPHSDLLRATSTTGLARLPLRRQGRPSRSPSPASRSVP